MIEPNKGAPKHRLQLDVTLPTLQDLDDLKERSGSATRAETIRQALKAYAILLEILPGSVAIASLDGKGQIRREVPSKVFK